MLKKKLSSIIILLVLLLNVVVPYPADASMLVDFYNTGWDNTISIFGGSWRAQTFTATASYHIEKVRLQLSKLGSPGVVTVSILDTLAGLPTGADIYTGTISGSLISVGSSWYDINLTGSVQLTSGHKYAIVVRLPDGNSSNNVLLYRDSAGSTYSNGDYCTSTNSGVTWSVVAGQDLMFEVYAMSNSAPVGVVNFSSNSTARYTRHLSWTLSDNAIGVVVVRDYENYVDNITGNGGVAVYTGVSLTTDDLGNAVILPAYYSVWEYNYSYNQTIPSHYYIGGEPVNVTMMSPFPTMTVATQPVVVTVGLSIALIGIIVGFLIIFINIKLKSPLLWFGAAICFIGVYLDPNYADTYWAVGAGIIIIFCIIMAFFNYRTNRSGYSGG